MCDSFKMYWPRSQAMSVNMQGARMGRASRRPWGRPQTPARWREGVALLKSPVHSLNFVFYQWLKGVWTSHSSCGLSLSCSRIKFALFILKLSSLWSFIPHTLWIRVLPGRRRRRPHGTAILTAGLTLLWSRPSDVSVAWMCQYHGTCSC